MMFVFLVDMHVTFKIGNVANFEDLLVVGESASDIHDRGAQLKLAEYGSDASKVEFFNLRQLAKIDLVVNTPK